MTHLLSSRNKSAEGFTIVETVVTLAVISIFLVGFFQAYILMTSQRVKLARQANASDIAYTNLRKVMARPSVLNCNQTTGYTLLSSENGADSAAFYRPEDDRALGEKRSQTVIAYPTVDCANFTNNPVKIVSTVVFDIGSPGGETKVVHASYIP